MCFFILLLQERFSGLKYSLTFTMLKVVYFTYQLYILDVLPSQSYYSQQVDFSEYVDRIPC